MKRTEGGAEEQINIDSKTNKPYPVPRLPLVSLEEAEAFRIDEAIASIYHNYPFLGYVFCSLKREERWDIPTAAISADNILYFNPRFMASLTSDERSFVLLHEILHKINNHFARSDVIMKLRHNMSCREFIEWRKRVEGNSTDNPMTKKEAKKYYKKVDRISRLLKFMNVCEDLSINQICELKFGRLPIGIFLDDTNKEFNLEMEAMQEWEYYFKELEQNNTDLDHQIDHDIQIVGGGNGSGSGVTVELTENEKKQYDQMFKSIAKKAANLQKKHEAKQGQGNGPNYTLSDILPDMEVEIDDSHVWENIISKNFGFHRISEQEATLKRPNRRDDENPWGKRRRTINKHTVVILDTSGSCSHVMEKFLGVINNAMQRYKTTIDLILTTTHVYKVHENLKYIDMEKINIQGGGTDLTTAQKWIMLNKDNEGSGINVIVLTDGYTDWIADTKFTVSAIYTERHAPLKGVTNYATIYED